jgi:uncharacterized protein (TIGR02118 family)
VHRVQEEQDVIKISVFYPYGEGKKFEMGYYCNKHIPMVKELLGASCRGTSVEQGLAGGEPGSKPTYCAMGHLYFDSVEAFQAAFGPHSSAIMGDLPNFTDIQPTLQISEVVMK